MSARRRARRCALQALYACEFSELTPDAVCESFAQDARRLEHADREWFTRLVHEVHARREELDAALEPCLERELARLDPTVHIVLCMGLYELRHCPQVPWKVVINEAVELAREFCGDNAYRLINAVLDRVRLAEGGEHEVP